MSKFFLLLLRCVLNWGELDYPTNYSEPHPLILATLDRYDNAVKMYEEGLPTDLD